MEGGRARSAITCDSGLGWLLGWNLFLGEEDGGMRLAGLGARRLAPTLFDN